MQLLGTPEAKWSFYLAAAFCLCIAGWQASSFVVALKLRSRMKQAREGLSTRAKQPVPALEAADMSDFVVAPTVTENTTELLEPVKESKRQER